MAAPRILGTLFALMLGIVAIQPHLVTAFAGDFSVRHECYRTCEWPPKPMTCRYEFNVEWYYSMSTACYDCPYNLTDCSRPHCIPINGVPRGITTINRQFPGPSVEVCEHDTIEVKVINNLVNSESVSIHWHGIHQRETPHMDGVSLITQCPIPYRSSFTYKFKPDTVGTHFWHIHGLSRANGGVGPLVVRQASPDDPHSTLYDYDLQEHVIFVQDWVNQLYVDRFSRILFGDLRIKPDTLLINGRGQYTEFVDKPTNKSIYIPRTVFNVKSGKRYRFRVISSNLMDCSLELSIDHHNMTIIASDGDPVEPVEAGAFGLTSGERYDFVLHANAPAGKYWLRVKGYDDCEDITAMARVVYDGSSHHPDPPAGDIPSYNRGPIVNPFNSKSSPAVVNVNELTPAVKDEEEIPEADVVHYIGLDLQLINNINFNHPVYYPVFTPPEGVDDEDVDDIPIKGLPSPQMNHVSFKHPTSPLITQSHEIPELEFCSFESTESRQEYCTTEFCECIHVLHVELGKVIELVIIDEGKLFTKEHPMHLHGYRFHVLALDKLGDMTTVEEVKLLDKAGNITRRTRNAPRKDTVVPPDGGYVVIRFVADNPGWWMFHCHGEFHFLAGMATVIHVGSNEDLPAIPKNFPRCGGDFYPVEETKESISTSPAGSSGSAHAAIMTSLVWPALTLLPLLQ